MWELWTAGGNDVQSAPAGKISDWVKAHNGHTVITKVSFGCPTHIVKSIDPLLRSTGPYCQQRYRRCERDPFDQKVVLRDVWG